MERSLSLPAQSWSTRPEGQGPSRRWVAGAIHRISRAAYGSTRFDRFVVIAEDLGKHLLLLRLNHRFLPVRPRELLQSVDGSPVRGDDELGLITPMALPINVVRSEVESGDTAAELEGAKMLMLVNRKSGRGLGIALSES
jgi:hypothetical protein